uniref:Uncharacterized protein n=1 Tax=Rhizophora mucronata TaxID=61149 RepID=A0A2P2QZA8_RHIMU
MISATFMKADGGNELNISPFTLQVLMIIYLVGGQATHYTNLAMND